MFEEIKQGKELKKPETELATGEKKESLSLLEQIRQGENLKKAPVEEKESEPVKENTGGYLNPKMMKMAAERELEAASEDEDEDDNEWNV